MAYLKDLSAYTYGDGEFAKPGTLAVGWLSRNHDFPTNPPSDAMLDLLWLFCSTSVALARGFHDCEFCPSGSAYYAERAGRKLLLGAAEIRVFGDGTTLYAAPTLIYHYVSTHHYQPPDEFVRALETGPRPPEREYFDELDRLGLKWSPTSTGEGRRVLGAEPHLL
jgi:hypothetical protein